MHVLRSVRGTSPVLCSSPDQKIFHRASRDKQAHATRSARSRLDDPPDTGEHRFAMKFTGIDHVTVVITDPERAIAFYRDVLGLQQMTSPSTFPGAGLNVRWFKAGNQFVHLYIAAEADKPSPRHFALHVESAKAARETLQARGITIRETTPIPGAERFFVADPDGNRVEIIQWKDTSEIRPMASGSAAKSF